MKTLKKATNTQTLKDRFTLGQTIKWNGLFFDGRVTTVTHHEATIIKINRVTVDVEFRDGGLARLDLNDLNKVKSLLGK